MAWVLMIVGALGFLVLGCWNCVLTLGMVRTRRALNALVDALDQWGGKDA